LAGPSTREESPRGRAQAGTSGAVTAIPVIVALLIIGLILRLIIAYVFFPGSGFPNDLGAFQAWGNQIAHAGPVGFYDRPGFLDYPPVYLLLLGAMSFLSGGEIGEGVKILPILADLGLATVVWTMAREMGVSGRRAVIAALIVLLNPITWFNSAIWGQADSVGSIFLLLGLRELQKDRRETASALAVLAFLTKLQLGILGVIVGFVVLRRSLRPKTGQADPERVLTSIGAGLLTAALVCMPFTGLDFPGLVGRLTTVPGALTIIVGLLAGLGVFSLGRRYLPIDGSDRRTLASLAAAAVTVVGFGAMVFDSIVNRLINTFGEYPYLTLNAYNPWALVRDTYGNSMSSGLSWLRDVPWTRPETGVTEPGFLVGPLSTEATIFLACGAVALAVGALAARKVGRGTPAEIEAPAGSDGSPAESPMVEATGPALAPAGRLAVEFHGLAGVFGVIAAALAVFTALAATGSVYAGMLGSGTLLAVMVFVGIWAAWRDDAQSLLVALTILSIAFFVVPTRVHERYLFPFFGLAAILLVGSWRWRVAYVVLAVVNTANLLAVLVQYQGIPGNGWLAGTFNDWGNGIRTATWSLPATDHFIWPIVVSSVATGLVMIWALAQMRKRAVDALAGEMDRAAMGADLPVWMTGAGSDEDDRDRAGVEDRLVAASATDPAYFADLPAGAPDESPAGRSREPLYVPRWAMSLWHRISAPSSYPDRSASLNREPRGRLDKLDIWVVVALILAVLSMRVYRLGEPTQMHFDEVYHARTGTEFLQDWKYGIRHDIYEWTHPHLAKYAIATSISVFDDFEVKSRGSLGVPVKDIVVQPRTNFSPDGPQSIDPDAMVNYDTRYGDRVLVATGSQVRVYDLETRALTHTYAIPGASAFSEVGPTGLLYVGTTDGYIYRLDTNSLDDVRARKAATVAAPVKLTVATDIAISGVFAKSAPYILVSDAIGNVVSIDLTVSGGKIVGRNLIPGAADFAELGTGPATVTADPAKVTNIAAEGQALASFLNLDASPILAALTTSNGGLEVVLPVGALTTDQATSLNSRVAAGEFPGISVSLANPQVLVAYRNGVGLVDARYLVINSTLVTDSPATSIAINPNQSQSSYVAAGNSIILIKIDSNGASPTATQDGFQPLRRMPGAVSKVYFDNGTKIVHALGRTADGKSPTVYAIETNGNAVFDDAVLPFEPVAIGIDSTSQMPDVNREAMLAFAPDGSMASVDVGQFAFSWRVVGVLFGALMAVCMYLLARVLFRRRTVGLFVAAFSLVDGMLFAQSRIAMNDTYVGGLLLLAYLIFALLWLNPGKNRAAFWAGMPILGVVLGLALAAKWVALYAIASIGVLILIRSALGRLIAILGLAAGTGVLGWKAIAEMSYAKDSGDPTMTAIFLVATLAVVAVGTMWAMTTRLTPDKVFVGIATAIGAGLTFAAALAFSPGALQNGAPNYTFFVILLTVTALAAAANAYRPVAWTRQELQFTIAAPMVIGVLAVLLGLVRHSSGLTMLGGGAVALGLLVWPAFWLGGRVGFGPLAIEPRAGHPASFAAAPSPAPTGWLRLGSGFGLPAIWTGLCVAVLPIAVYALMYLPWAVPWHAQVDDGPNATGPLPSLFCLHTDVATGLCDNAFPAGHTGQTLWDMTIQMYNYHNDLRASHAASSPWWAWPMDLKPVWFDSGGDVQGMSSWIHDGGNPALWWIAIFAMAFLVWQAFKRRNLGLALIAVAFFWQWLSWARIDRAAFQYHFYTALPFFLMGLAYFLAELWHGPSRRTWLLARVAGAAALLFPGAMWLLKPELCGLARVDASEYFGNTVCGTSTGDVILTAKMILIGLTLIAALAAMAIVLWRLERRQEEGIEDRNWVVQLIAPVGVAFALIFWLGGSGLNEVVFHAALPSDLMAVFLGLVGAIMSIFALTARNPRRFTLGICVVAVIAFLALYPDLSALWLPSKIQGIYYALLPTWMYGFQFSVNLQPSLSVSMISSSTILSSAFALFVAAVAAWVAWERRVVVGYYRARRLRGNGSADDASGDAATDDAATDAVASETDRPEPVTDGAQDDTKPAVRKRAARKPSPPSEP
jgi:hypothetical protein